jgi:peptide/nickel transport system substrate-binding protein
MGTDRRISRRALVTGAAGLGAGTLAVRGIAAHGTNSVSSLLCSCDSYAALRPGARGAPTLLRYRYQQANIPTPRNQTVIVDQTANNIWDSFNPFIPNGMQPHYGLHQTCRECLFYVNFEKGEVIPWLAQKYEYNPDFTQFTLTLTPNVTWNDGQPFSADDVVYTLNLLKENANYNGADQVRAYVASVTAADPLTVVVALSEPNPRFHYLFMAGIYDEVIKTVPKHVWENQDAGSFTNNPPVFTGPYVLDQILPDLFMYVWKKNPNYWNKANFDPKPGYFIVRTALPEDAEVQEFTRGNADVPGINYLSMQAIQGSYKDWFEFDFSDPCPRGIWLNQDSPSGLFATKEGRWAISSLLDRETIANTIWQPASIPAEYPWANWGMHDRWANSDIKAEYPFTFDPAKAEQLLDQIGATKSGDKRQLNGKNIALTCITPTNAGDPEYQIATLLAQEAEKVGIDIEVKTLLSTAMWDAYELGDYDLTSHWLCGVALDPAQLYGKFLTRQYKPIGERAVHDNNETRTQIPELNDVTLQLEKVNPDDPANKPVFDQGLEAYLANLPAMPSIQTIYPFAFGTSYWTGWPTNDNKYNIAANWWAQFLFVIGQLQPTGKE